MDKGGSAKRAEASQQVCADHVRLTPVCGVSAWPVSSNVVGLLGWLGERKRSRGREAFDVWSSARESDGLGDRADAEPSSEARETSGQDSDLGPAIEPQRDWTSDPIEIIPPWRRTDRAVVDAARVAAASSDHAAPRASTSLARDLRRLAELNGDDALSDREFVAAVRARLKAEGQPPAS